jgi:hypothetical protein
VAEPHRRYDKWDNQNRQQQERAFPSSRRIDKQRRAVQCRVQQRQHPRKTGADKSGAEDLLHLFDDAVPLAGFMIVENA